MIELKNLLFICVQRYNYLSKNIQHLAIKYIFKNKLLTLYAVILGKKK